MNLDPPNPDAALLRKYRIRVALFLVAVVVVVALLSLTYKSINTIYVLNAINSAYFIPVSHPARGHPYTEAAPAAPEVGSLCGPRGKRHGPVPRDLRAGHGGSRREAANARYTPEATTWVKIKNREYSQAIGREDFFDRRRPAAQRNDR